VHVWTCFPCRNSSTAWMKIFQNNLVLNDFTVNVDTFFCDAIFYFFWSQI
jgi:hypothetical protein